MKPVGPLHAIGLGVIPARGIDWEARGRYDLTTTAEELEHDAKADLHSSARHKSHATVEVAALGALRPVELGAGRAQCGVKGVQLAVGRLADVARPCKVEAGRRSREQRLVVDAERRGRGAVGDGSRRLLKGNKALALSGVEARVTVVAAVAAACPRIVLQQRLVATAIGEPQRVFVALRLLHLI